MSLGADISASFAHRQYLAAREAVRQAHEDQLEYYRLKEAIKGKKWKCGPWVWET